jgi:ribose 5-phosphate isomerase B
MRVFIASDHGGFAQKKHLTNYLSEQGYEVVDHGSHSAESTDYPQYAVTVGQSVQQEPDAKGVLLCRSGEGMEMAANKLKGIRAALVWRSDVAAETRRDNDANVLVLPADFLQLDEMKTITDTFLTTAFSGEERHQRRIDQISALEERV